MAVADPELTRIAALFARVYDRPVDAVYRIGDGVNMCVYAARLADDPVERVMKMAGDDDWKPWAVLDEQAVMNALRDEGVLEVPLIEYTQEHVAWTERPFFTMRRITPGINIENGIGPDHPDAERIWRAAGALRARLGRVDWQCTMRSLTPRQAWAQIGRFLNWDKQALDALPVYRGVFDALLDAVRALSEQGGDSFGQMDEAEILLDGDGLALVDFSGFVGAHRRLRELGSINGRLRWRYGGDPRIPAWQEAGFFGDETITPEMRHELTLHEISELASGAGWLAQAGRSAERDSRLAYARSRLGELSLA
jgi:Phosphotransferase enzyme family